MSKINITSPIGNLMYVMISGQGKENYEGTGYDYQACVDIADGKEADAFIDMIEDFVEANEVKYKVALKLLNIMLRNGLISSAEYEKIDELNRQTFTPELAKVYA